MIPVSKIGGRKDTYYCRPSLNSQNSNSFQGWRCMGWFTQFTIYPNNDVLQTYCKCKFTIYLNDDVLCGVWHYVQMYIYKNLYLIIIYFLNNKCIYL